MCAACLMHALTLSCTACRAAERVNLVANLDLPPSGESYAHRVGRTGRFGTRGVAVTFVTAAELPALRRLLAGVPGAQVRPDRPAYLYLHKCGACFGLSAGYV